MSKIGHRPSPAMFQQARSEGSNKSDKSDKSEKSEGKEDVDGELDGLPSVGLGGLEQADNVDQWNGGESAQYTDDAVDQHNEIGTKAARGELLGQNQNNFQGAPQNKQLLREVDTLKSRLAKLEGKLQAGGTQEIASTQGVQPVAGGVRQVGRAYGGGASRREAPIQANNVEAVTQKQGGPLDDDLPRVGLK